MNINMDTSIFPYLRLLLDKLYFWTEYDFLSSLLILDDLFLYGRYH